MTKSLVVALGIFLGAGFLSGCSLKKSPAALQINTEPAANVFIDGKLIGKTPYQSNEWKEGEYNIKLIPESTSSPLASWEGKIRLNAGVLTLIERKFGATEAQSSGQILSLEKAKDKKKASLAIVSGQDGALIHIDGEAKGFTPITIEEVGVGDHQITLSKDGYEEKLVKARAIAGYRLIVNVILSEDGTASAAQVDSSFTPSSSDSAEEDGKTVEIKETPTGWLRVRKGPSTVEPEVAKVNPGGKYPLLEEKSGWYKIQLEDEKEGWISAQYATKL